MTEDIITSSHDPVEVVRFLAPAPARWFRDDLVQAVIVLALALARWLHP